MSHNNKQHQDLISKFWNNGAWKFPCCGEEIIWEPTDEYPEEEQTTISCDYGCGFIILDDYIHLVDTATKNRH